MSRLQKKYKEQIVPELAKEFGVNNEMAVPKITKVIINQGIGEISRNKELLTKAKDDLAAICGQSPSVRAAKVSVASFSIRRGMPVGFKVTLRGKRMYEFLDRLFSAILPRLRDFRGVSLKSFDEHGNYSLGIEDHSVFPEIDIAKSGPKSLEITIVTNTDDNKKAKRLLELLGMPFQKNDQ